MTACSCLYLRDDPSIPPSTYRAYAAEDRARCPVHGAAPVLHVGDCRLVMSQMPAGYFDAIVTDPPYELGFMGKGWDGSGVAYDVATWTAALRVLKPGGHMVAFGAPRNFHRMTCAIEDAGFEIRDCLMWLFGSGFPKSLDVSKALDKAAGVERELTKPGVVQRDGYGDDWGTGSSAARPRFDAPATEAASKWEGWGTALKPAFEPIVLARKPLAGTVAANVQAYGVGGLNIDGCRTGAVVRHNGPGSTNDRLAMGDGWRADFAGTDVAGRWPANVLLDEEAAAILDEQSGSLTSGETHILRRGSTTGAGMGYGSSAAGNVTGATYGDTGGASRFFYTAKASRSEREYGLDDLEGARRSDGRNTEHHVPNLRTNARRNDHPTVKPIDLMRWLCRLVTPPNGLILDPFMGSGSTGMAALDEGFRFVGIDQDAHYVDIARRRIERRHLIETMPQVSEGQGVLL